MRVSKHRRRGLIAVGLAGVAVATGMTLADASSHREAPLITEDPVADNTDVYAFVAPDAPDTVTLVANWIPLEAPVRRPELPQVRRRRAVQAQRRQQRRRRRGRDLRVPVHDADREPEHVPVQHRTGHVARTTPTSTSGRPTRSPRSRTARVRDCSRRTCPWRRRTSVPGRRRTTTRCADAATYDAAATGVKVFAGPRDDPFFVDLGSIFDLGGLRPLNPAHVDPAAGRGRCRRLARVQHAHHRAPGADSRRSLDGPTR